MRPERRVAEALAHAFLAGEATAEALAARAEWTLGRKSRWIAAFCLRVFQRFGARLDSSQRARLIRVSARTA